ncbi:MAG: pseudouridine-5'-phosphate glycosidase [Syntrophomonadaceae bacterium]|nr:pseudouridine-5'-phosphate glycosidase [Syntrophomonadaceae bacterium]
MGGVTGERISQDLVAIAEKPVFFISSGFKDLIDAENSLGYLRSQGIKVLGWKKSIYDGFLFTNESYNLDGLIDENNINDINFQDGKGILIFNPVPEELRLNNKELLELARKKMKTARERGEDFHPIVNKLLDEETKGMSSFIQLLALIANLNLALQISAQLGGKRNGFN